MKKEQLLGQKILLLGLGRENLAVARFLLQLGHRDFAVLDERPLPQAGQDFLQENQIDFLAPIEFPLAAGKASAFNILVPSPGIRPEKFSFFKKGEIVPAAEIFCANFPGRIVAVTGTKGKSTTAHAIFQILQTCGRPSFLCGNFGAPALDFLKVENGEIANAPSEIAVLELSSFQANFLRTPPQVVVFTSFFPDHLDWHGNLENYFQAKWRPLQMLPQSGVAIFPENFPAALQEIFPKSLAAKALAGIKARKIFCPKVAPKKNLQIFMPHDLQNFALASAACRIFKVSQRDIENAWPEIPILPHRGNLVAGVEHDGRRFFNFSIAVNPGAVLEVVRNFPQSIGGLILGGADRGLDFSTLVREIAHKKIPALTFFPPSGERILQELQESFSPSWRPAILQTEKMLPAVEFAFEHSPKNSAILLAPAAPSFGLWDNFEIRGQDFEASALQVAGGRFCQVENS